MNKVLTSALFCATLLATCITGSYAQTPSVTAVSAQSQDANTSSKTAICPPEYKLQPGDVMNIKVWNESNLSGEHVVDPKGYISLAFVGQIYAQGLTQRELTDQMKEALTKYLVEPKIELAMIQFHKLSVYVLGQVNRPGQHEIQSGDGLMESIAAAGSFTEDAKLDSVTVTHQGSTEIVKVDLGQLLYEGDMSKNLVLQDGDTVYVPLDTMNKYFVLGEVNRPGVFKFKKGTTVIDAITIASGPTDRGDLSKAYVIRGNPNSEESRIHVDVQKLIKSADMKQNVALLPGDVVYLSETTKLNWSKISQVISSVVNGAYLVRLFGK